MATEGGTYTFEELIENGSLLISDGYRAKNDELGGDGHIFLRAGHVTDTHIDLTGVARFHESLSDRVASKMAKARDVVITTKGNSTGRTTYITADLPPFVYSPHLSFWRSTNHDVIFPEFLRYWARSQQFQSQLEGFKISTDMAPYLSLIDQKRLRITLPSIENQHSIAEILSALDDKIELNRRMNATLEAMAQALFKSWFVDFDPVKAKAAGRAPEGMDTDTAVLFPSEFVESELGLIPKGWEVGTMRDCCLKVESGGTPSRKNPEYWEKGTIPWLTSSEVRNPIVYDTKEYISELGLKNSNAKLWPTGTTVVAMYGATAGEVCLLAGSLTANQACCGLLPKEGFRCFIFIHAVRSKSEIAGKASGSAQQNLNQSLVASFGTIIPSPKITSAFENQTASLIDKWIANERENESLKNTCDALLPKLISGQLRIPEVGAVME